MSKKKNGPQLREHKELDQQTSLIHSIFSELAAEHALEEEGMEALYQLLEIGEKQGTIDVAHILQLIPEAEEDQELLEGMVDLLRLSEIQVMNDAGDIQYEGSPDKDEDDALLEVDDEIHLSEDLQGKAADAGDTVGLYLSQVGAVPLLTHAEEIELAKRIERGREASRELATGSSSANKRSILKHLVEDGQAAREHLLLANVRLVFSVAKKYAGRGIPLLDLVQEGHIGLMRATKKFDFRRGYKFSTYATWWIRQAVSRYVADHGRTIRLPVHIGDRINRLLRIRHRLIQDLGREPTVEELADELGEPQAVIEDMLKYSQRAISLDTPVNEEDDSTLSDFIENEEAPDPLEITTQQLLSEHVNELLAQLPSREARVLRLRFGLSGGHAHTLNEIGNKMGITRERVRQIEAQARHRIRRYGLQDHLREYLEE